MSAQLEARSFDAHTKYDFARLAKSDPDKAIEMFDAGMRSSRADFTEMAPNFVSELIKNGDGEKSLLWIAKYPELHGSGNWTFVAETLGESDPELGVRLFDLLSGNFRSSVLEKCFGKVASRDFSNALKRAAALENVADRDGALVAVAFQGVADGKYSDALQGLDSLSRGVPNRQRLVGTIIANWFLHDASSALERLSALNYSDKQLVLGSAQFRSVIFGNIPAPQGLQLLQQLALTQESKGLFSTYCVEFSKRDMGAVVQYLNGMQESGTKGEIVRTVFENFVANGQLDEALAYRANLASKSKELAMRGIVKSVSASDIGKALELTAREPVESRVDLYREVGRAAVYNNTAEAVRIIEDPELTRIIGNGFRAEMLDHTVRVWAKQDLDSAKAWVEKLPDGDRSNGVRGLMTPWMKSDPIAASQWLATLPAGPVRDEGAKVVIEQVKDTDPEMAEKWRESISTQPKKSK